MGGVCGKEEPINFNGDGIYLIIKAELLHFELLRSIGKGAFGKVFTCL